MKRQLNEASDIQGKSDTKLSQALQGLRVLQEEKGSLEAKLGQKQAALQAQVSVCGFIIGHTNLADDLYHKNKTITIMPTE